MTHPDECRRGSRLLQRPPAVHHAFELKRVVGMGYLTLGQPSPTPPDVRRQQQPHTLYILDEPTVGLHTADVERLSRVLQRKVEQCRYLPFGLLPAERGLARSA